MDLNIKIFGVFNISFVKLLLVFNGNNGIKINTHIDFPTDDLNLTNYISSSKNDPNNYIYSLYAINYHSGTSQGGHYWSSCKNLDKNWYLYNDSNVTKFQNNNLLSKDAYMLFYYRKYIK